MYAAISELKDYTLLEPIGRGSFGDAYIVEHKATGAKYVLKQVRLARQQEWQRAASHLEMQLAEELAHPFIVPHFESRLDRGHTIQMIHEYCEGGDLCTYLKQRKGALIPEDRLKEWLAQGLLALLYLQSKGVIHRDLKPANLFLNSKDDLLVGDFGLAALRRDGVDQDNSVVGTASYMSPELISGRPYTFSTDVWSLGCCFWELTSQEPPFKAQFFGGLKSKVRRGHLPSLPKEYSHQWGLLLKEMITTDAARRASVADLLCAPCMTAATAAAVRRSEAVAAERGYMLPQLPQTLVDTPDTPHAALTGPTGPLASATESGPFPPSPPMAAPVATVPETSGRSESSSAMCTAVEVITSSTLRSDASEPSAASTTMHTALPCSPSAAANGTTGGSEAAKAARNVAEGPEVAEASRAMAGAQEAAESLVAEVKVNKGDEQRSSGPAADKDIAPVVAGTAPGVSDSAEEPKEVDKANKPMVQGPVPSAGDAESKPDGVLASVEETGSKRGSELDPCLNPLTPHPTAAGTPPPLGDSAAPTASDITNTSAAPSGGAAIAPQAENVPAIVGLPPPPPGGLRATTGATPALRTSPPDPSLAINPGRPTPRRLALDSPAGSSSYPTPAPGSPEAARRSRDTLDADGKHTPTKVYTNQMAGGPSDMPWESDKPPAWYQPSSLARRPNRFRVSAAGSRAAGATAARAALTAARERTAAVRASASGALAARRRTSAASAASASEPLPAGAEAPPAKRQVAAAAAAAGTSRRIKGLVARLGKRRAGPSPEGSSAAAPDLDRPESSSTMPCASPHRSPFGLLRSIQSPFSHIRPHRSPSPPGVSSNSPALAAPTTPSRLLLFRRHKVPRTTVPIHPVPDPTREPPAPAASISAAPADVPSTSDAGNTPPLPTTLTSTCVSGPVVSSTSTLSTTQAGLMDEGDESRLLPPRQSLASDIAPVPAMSAPLETTPEKPPLPPNPPPVTPPPRPPAFPTASDERKGSSRFRKAAASFLKSPKLQRLRHPGGTLDHEGEGDGRSGQLSGLAAKKSWLTSRVSRGTRASFVPVASSAPLPPRPQNKPEPSAAANATAELPPPPPAAEHSEAPDAGKPQKSEMEGLTETEVSRDDVAGPWAQPPSPVAAPNVCPESSDATLGHSALLPMPGGTSFSQTTPSKVMVFRNLPPDDTLPRPQPPAPIGTSDEAGDSAVLITLGDTVVEPRGAATDASRDKGSSVTLAPAILAAFAADEATPETVDPFLPAAEAPLGAAPTDPFAASDAASQALGKGLAPAPAGEGAPNRAVKADDGATAAEGALEGNLAEELPGGGAMATTEKGAPFLAHEHENAAPELGMLIRLGNVPEAAPTDRAGAAPSHAAARSRDGAAPTAQSAADAGPSVPAFVGPIAAGNECGDSAHLTPAARKSEAEPAAATAEQHCEPTTVQYLMTLPNKRVAEPATAGTEQPAATAPAQSLISSASVDKAEPAAAAAAAEQPTATTPAQNSIDPASVQEAAPSAVDAKPPAHVPLQTPNRVEIPTEVKGTHPTADSADTPATSVATATPPGLPLAEERSFRETTPATRPTPLTTTPHEEASGSFQELTPSLYGVPPSSAPPALSIEASSQCDLGAATPSLQHEALSQFSLAATPAPVRRTIQQSLDLIRSNKVAEAETLLAALLDAEAPAGVETERGLSTEKSGRARTGEEMIEERPLTVEDSARHVEVPALASRESGASVPGPESDAAARKESVTALQKSVMPAAAGLSDTELAEIEPVSTSGLLPVVQLTPRKLHDREVRKEATPIGAASEDIAGLKAAKGTAAATASKLVGAAVGNGTESGAEEAPAKKKAVEVAEAVPGNVPNDSAFHKLSPKEERLRGESGALHADKQVGVGSVEEAADKADATGDVVKAPGDVESGPKAVGPAAVNSEMKKGDGHGAPVDTSPAREVRVSTVSDDEAPLVDSEAPWVQPGAPITATAADTEGSLEQPVTVDAAQAGGTEGARDREESLDESAPRGSAGDAAVEADQPVSKSDNEVLVSKCKNDPLAEKVESAPVDKGQGLATPEDAPPDLGESVRSADAPVAAVPADTRLVTTGLVAAKDKSAVVPHAPVPEEGATASEDAAAVVASSDAAPRSALGGGHVVTTGALPDGDGGWQDEETESASNGVSRGALPESERTVTTGALPTFSAPPATADVTAPRPVSTDAAFLDGVAPPVPPPNHVVTTGALPSMAVDAAEAATADDAERSFDPVAGGASAVSAEQESTENIGGARNGEEGASPPSSSAWTPPECPGSAVVHVRLVPSAVDPGNVALDVALTSGGSAVPAGVTGDRKETADLKDTRRVESHATLTPAAAAVQSEAGDPVESAVVDERGPDDSPPVPCTHPLPRKERVRAPGSHSVLGGQPAQVTPALDLGGVRSGDRLEDSEDSPARRAGVCVGDVVMLHREEAFVGYIGGVRALGGGEFLGLRLVKPWPGNPSETPWIKFEKYKEAPACDLWVPSSRVLEQIGLEYGRPSPRPLLP